MFDDNGFIRSDRGFVTAMVSVIVFFIALGAYQISMDHFIGFGGFYDSLRIGFCSGQFCWYSRSTAGATPPSLEELLNPVTPFYTSHGYAKNLAKYTAAAIPAWPILFVIGWPAFRWIRHDWARRWIRAVGEPRRGFEPILRDRS